MGEAQTVSYPDPGREVESWAETLMSYPGGGLERDDEEHVGQLLAGGWSHIGGCWDPPPRQRRSVEQAGEIVRRAVQRVDRRNPPAHTMGPAVGAMVGALEALGDLLFYPTVDEAWANATVKLRGMGGGKRRTEDPLRPRFVSVDAVIGVSKNPLIARSLGMGSPSYQVAQSSGRTRANWDEIHCSQSHTSGASIKGLQDSEAVVEAQWALRSSGVSEVDIDGLDDWLLCGASPEERVRRYRRRLIEPGEWRRIAPYEDADEDRRARIRTAHLTDRAILELLTRARAKLDAHLAKLPARAEALAAETGDVSFLAPLVARRPERERTLRQRQRREPVAPVRAPAQRWL